MNAIRFTVRQPGGDRRHFITEDEVRVVLSRLPEELWARLRHVHFNDRSMGNRTLGYVNFGRREIALCALAPRGAYARALHRGQCPAEFGAVRATRWPALAVRRFMLYHVFLHELGHLQLVRPAARDLQRKYAREPLAESFADYWRRRLWATPFEHADPVHSPPGAAERQRASGGRAKSAGVG